MKKKVLSFILVLAMALSMLPMAVFAEDPAGLTFGAVGADVDLYGKKAADLGEFDYQTTDKTVTITGKANYITGWTAFNGTDVEEQSGFYLPINIDAKKAGDVTVTGSKEKTFTLTEDDTTLQLVMYINKLTNKTFTVKIGDDTYTVNCEGVTTSYPIKFTDVSPNAYYANAVAWAVENKIVFGTDATTFSPDESCTRAQLVAFLWRAAGSPATEGTVSFTDVADDDYYYGAVKWAVAQGIAFGTDETTFSPDEACTREQTVAFLYRYANSPEVSGNNAFTDVPSDAYYANAVQWAVAEKITFGTSATTFSPDDTCTRAQAVAFLYRDMA